MVLIPIVTKKKMIIESDDVDTRTLWREYYSSFCIVINNKEGGFNLFPFHLAAQLYHRDKSRQCDTIIPH